MRELFPKTFAMLRLLVVVDIDLGLLPLAGRDAALEHDVDFAVRAVLHFWQTPPCNDQAYECCGTPYVTASALDCEVVSN